MLRLARSRRRRSCSVLTRQRSVAQISARKGDRGRSSGEPRARKPARREATVKEIGRLRLAEALELTLLIAREDPRRHPRVAARWLRRYLDD